MIEIIIKCSDDVRGSRNIHGEPTEEIVRCKDCKYYNAETETRPSPCPMLSTLYDATPNDFCSWAKMKGGTE